jgi:hypothetical protein
MNPQDCRSCSPEASPKASPVARDCRIRGGWGIDPAGTWRTATGYVQVCSTKCGCVRAQISHAVEEAVEERFVGAALVPARKNPIHTCFQAVILRRDEIAVGCVLSDHVTTPVPDSPAGPSGRPRGGMEPRSIAAKRSETLDFDVTAPLLTAAVAQPANCTTTESDSDIALLGSPTYALISPTFSVFSRHPASLWPRNLLPFHSRQSRHYLACVPPAFTAARY